VATADHENVLAKRLKYNRMHGLVHGEKPSTQAFPYNGYDRLGTEQEAALQSEIAENKKQLGPIYI
jgi:hypothetical protein